MEQEYKIKDIKYGLIAIDPIQEGEMKDILHFCGYWEKPSDADAISLKHELMTDESFGLTKIADRLVILPAPDEIIKHYLDQVEDE
jgi:hypothetical protein